jgi:NAD/NADP transhydrogenase alpha subunit
MSRGDMAIGFVALATAAFNLVGGFVITDRMTGLFKSHEATSGRGPAPTR